MVKVKVSHLYYVRLMLGSKQKKSQCVLIHLILSHALKHCWYQITWMWYVLLTVC
jgi:hypothetical protein